MSLNQKQILPDKINKLTIKLKSYAFMKIFMVEDQQLKKFHKIRHYDLELQGAAAISSWMKKKLQQFYLRGFLEIKDTQPQLVSLRYIRQPSQQSPKIQKLNFRNSPVKSTGKFRSQTDRQSQTGIKMPSYSTQQLIQKGSMVKVIYRSEYGSQNNNINRANKKHDRSNKKSQKQQQDRKSNLMSLLDKVRKVNTQSRQDKENYQKNQQGYGGLSCENSRVVSSHSVYTIGGNNINNWNKSNTNKKSNYASEQQQTARLSTVNSNINNYNNDLSFCTYGQTQRVNSINNLKLMRNHHNCPHPSNIRTQRVSENYTPVTYTISNPQHHLQQQQQMDKSNLMSLKKWNRNQKRNIIMSKINDLQKSLMYADNSTQRQQQDFYYNNNNNDEIYTSRDYYEIPANYSQGYLNMRTQRVPVRSVVQVRVRK